MRHLPHAVRLRVPLLLLSASALGASAAPAADALFVSTFTEGTIMRFDLPAAIPQPVVRGLGSVEDGACHPDGRIYFAESLDGVITSWEQDGSDPANIIPSAGFVPGPEGLSFDPAGNLYFNTREIFFTADGAWRLEGGDPTRALDQVVPPFTDFGEGSEIVLAGPHAGALLVVDRRERRVLISEPPGAPATVFIDTGAFPVGSQLFGVNSNGCGEVFVSARRDTPTGTRGAVLRFDPEGGFVDVFVDRVGARPLSGAQFMEFDSEGNLYVASSEDDAVFRVDPDGNASLFASLVEATGVAICRERSVPVCARGPSCDAGGPYLAECRAADGGRRIPLDGSASTSGTGGALRYTWTTDCPSASLDDPSLEGPQLLVPDPSCDLLCGVFLEVEDETRATAACSSEVRVVDTRPPEFREAGKQFEVSIWPPNHGYVVFDVADLVTAADACGDVTVAATGCRSNQPEEVHQGGTLLPRPGNGDGRFFEDCVLSEDGGKFAVRAERLGSCGADSARTYTIELTATDSCGNEAVSTGIVRVDHDRSDATPPKRGGRHLAPHQPPPFPYVHPTVYGDGCPDRKRMGSMR